MLHFNFFLFAIVAALLYTSALLQVSSLQFSDQIHRNALRSLTLHRGHMTTSRRGRPIPQLQCQGRYCSRVAHAIVSVQCYNQGTDGTGPQWSCKAQFPNGYDFDRLEVNCEGYSGPGDSFYLVGSCGLVYQVRKTLGHGGYDNGGGGGWGGDYYGGGYGGNGRYGGNHGGSMSFAVGIFIIIALVACLICVACIAALTNH